MPLYEYKCLKCDSTFEVIQKFSDEPLTIHADCGGTVQKQMSAPSFQLKGTGWYATDYKKTSSGKSDSGSDTKSEEKKDTKSDSKADSGDKPSSAPDSKTDTKVETKPAKNEAPAQKE